MEKSMKNFEAVGRFIEKGNEKKFTKKVSAVSESAAAEKIMSLFGSNHKVKRRHIFIEDLKETKKE